MNIESLSSAEVQELLRIKPREFAPGDIVAIYGPDRSTFTVMCFDKGRDELHVANSRDVYGGEWAGKFYIVRKAHYSNAPSPSEADRRGIFELTFGIQNRQKQKPPRRETVSAAGG